MHCAQTAEDIDTISFAYDSPMSLAGHVKIWLSYSHWKNFSSLVITSYCYDISVAIERAISVVELFFVRAVKPKLCRQLTVPQHRISTKRPFSALSDQL